MTAAAPPRLCVLDDKDRAHLQELVQAHGLAGATRLLQISRGVIASAVAGLNVRRGSLELVRDALAAQRNGKGASK